MKSFGAVTRASTPEELAAWAKQNLATWQRVVKASGATPN
jgi:tripartite-type tricarboxylate transporter receptor subunit TctC